MCVCVCVCVCLCVCVCVCVCVFVCLCLPSLLTCPSSRVPLSFPRHGPCPALFFECHTQRRQQKAINNSPPPSPFGAHRDLKGQLKVHCLFAPERRKQRERTRTRKRRRKKGGEGEGEGARGTIYWCHNGNKQAKQTEQRQESKEAGKTTTTTMQRMHCCMFERRSFHSSSPCMCQRGQSAVSE